MTEPGNVVGDPGVTVVVTHRVRRGREAEFEKLSSDTIAAATRFEGHLGANVFRPSGPSDPEYRIIFKFDRRSNLQRWTDSEELRELSTRAEELTQNPARVETLTGLETWFTLPGRPAIMPPPRYKMAVVTWLAIFPLITAMLALLGPLLAPLPFVFRTLVLTVLLVPVMTYVVMPQMTRLFAQWLYSPRPNRTRV